VKSEGFAFSAEAFLSLFLLFSAAFFFQPSVKGPDFERLYALQKSDDVLKVWLLENSFNPDSMLSDLQLAFPEDCVIVELRGIALNSCPKTSRFVSSIIYPLDSSLNEFSVRLTVYY